MSGNDAEFLKQVEAGAEIEKKKRELETERVNTQHEKMVENKARVTAIHNSKFGIIGRDKAKEIAAESTRYLTAAKNKWGFINPEFKDKIPFFEKNLILIGARTGEGKTTCVANVVYSMLVQKHPITGRPPRVLVITNEEDIVDFYNRITCLIKGWHYVDHDLFTEEQLKTFEQYIEILSNRITVVDDQHSAATGSLTGATTTPEGIEMIFQNLIENGDEYDAVIIDYYQGINESNKDPSLDEYKAQRRLTHVLEKYRKAYRAPIIVMAQIDPPDEERTVPFQRRVQGTKLICTRATFILEMIKHTQDLATEWVIHKGRFAKLGQSIKTGYKDGLFVPYSDAFIAEVQRKRERAADTEFNKTIGIKVGEAPREAPKVAETVNG